MFCVCHLFLDNLLADLEKATQHLRTNPSDHSIKMSAGPKTTQTKISKLTREYTITSKGGPIPAEITEVSFEKFTKFELFSQIIQFFQTLTASL